MGQVFLKTIINRSLSGALTITINTLCIVLISSVVKVPQDKVSSIVAILTGFTGLVILYRVSLPFNNRRKILLTLMSVLFFIIVIFFGHELMIYRLNLIETIILIIFMIITPITINIISSIVERIKILNVEYQ